MRLSPHDICGIGNKQKSETTNEKNNNLNKMLEDDFTNNEELEGYNPNWTLRKCCSKVLDQLSNIFPDKVYEILKNYLEAEMQNENWLIKYIYLFK